MFTKSLFKMGLVRKTAASLLALTCCLGCLVGCDNSKTPDKGEDSKQTTTQQEGTGDPNGGMEVKYYVPSVLSVTAGGETRAFEVRWKDNSMELYFENKVAVSVAFDGSGNQTEQIFYNEDGSVYSRKEFKYDENGNQTEYIKYDADGSLYYRLESTYDQNGNVTEMIETRGSGESIEYRYEYKFDQSGNMTEVELSYSDGYVVYRDRFEYDSNGNRTRAVYSFYLGEGGSTQYYEYKYDDNGNLTEKIEYGSDGSIEDRYEYTYDQYGYRMGTIWYGEDGSVVMEYTYSQYIEGTKAQQQFFKDFDFLDLDA